MQKTGLQSEQADHGRLLKLATTASVVTASVLIIGKLFAWYLTGSVSVLASLVDSLMDAVASLFNLFAVRYALQPPDKEHRFGHGKAESLSGLAQATFIAGSALFLVLESINRLIHPRELDAIDTGIGVIVFAIVVTLILLAIQRYVIRRTGSEAIQADALHYATDLLTGAGVLVALLLTYYFQWQSADAWFAIAIAGYILYSAWQIGSRSVQSLIDRELPDDDRRHIVALAKSFGGVQGVHDLRTRRSGPAVFIQLHLDIDGNLTLKAAHDIAANVDQAICQAYPSADVIIHQDPVEVAPATELVENKSS